MDITHIVRLAALSGMFFAIGADAQAPASASHSQSDYALAIRASPAEAKVGSEVRIMVTVRNISDHPVGIQVPMKNLDDGAFYYRTYVRDEDGVLLPETKFGRALRTRKGEHGEDAVFVGADLELVLMPGGTRTHQLLLNNLFDLKKPGKYSVEVDRDDAGRIAKSNLVTITITN
jgi:hypothetical protein